MILIRWLTFLLGSQTGMVTVLLFFISSIGKFWSCCLSFQWLSLKLKSDALFHRIACNDSHADWDDPCDYLRDDSWEDIFKLGASAAASEFYEWVQLGIDVYIPYCKYQVKPDSSSWFSAAFIAAIVRRNHYFYRNPLNLKENPDRLVIVTKGFLKLPNLYMLVKQKIPSCPGNVALGIFG